MSGLGAKLNIAFQVVSFVFGLYLMHQIIVEEHPVPAAVVPLIAYMIGFPIANLVDRVRSKERE